MSSRLRLTILGAVLAALAGPASAQRPDTLTLSLEDAVRLALRLGVEARLASAQVQLTNAQITTARAAGLPQLRINVTQTHVFENARAQAVGQIFNQPNTHNANANLSFAFFQGGRARAGLRLASRSRDAARLNAEEVRAQVTLDVQRAYVQALFASRITDIRTAIPSPPTGLVRWSASSGRSRRRSVCSGEGERATRAEIVEAGTRDPRLLTEALRIYRPTTPRPHARIDPSPSG